MGSLMRPGVLACAAHAALVPLAFALTPAAAEEALSSHTGTDVDYAVNLWWREF